MLLSSCFAAQAHAAEIDWTKVDTALGKTASVQGEVHRYGIPRTDLQVTLDGVAIKPAWRWRLARLRAHARWRTGHGRPCAHRDRGQSGHEQAAGERYRHHCPSQPSDAREPPTFYMHIHGMVIPSLGDGNPRCLAESKTPFAAPAATAAQSAQIDLDTDKLDAAIGVKGKVNGGVYQFSVPRKDPITEDGMPVPPAMGTAIAINFQPTGGGKAAITGDFVVTAEEVNPIIRVLRENSIEVTATHSHMLDEQPRLFFVHFWANDDAVKLAKGLQAALAKIAVPRS